MYGCRPGLEDQNEGEVQGGGVNIRVWSKVGRSNRGCGPGLEGQTERLVQGWSIRVRVWSKARTLYCGCCLRHED